MSPSSKGPHLTKSLGDRFEICPQSLVVTIVPLGTDLKSVPRPAERLAACDPMYPAPPVTKIWLFINFSVIAYVSYFVFPGHIDGNCNNLVGKPVSI